VPKLVSRTIATPKKILTVFLGVDGVMFTNWFPDGERFNNDYFCIYVLQPLAEILYRGRGAHSAKPIVHFDNATRIEIPPESVWELAVEGILHRHRPPSQLDSQIISEFPEIFAEFSRKHFKVLWRGNRDGFNASEFHGRCDGHANTLTVILDTKGNIFGGFTPAKWKSPQWNGKYWKENNLAKADYSEKSCIFTLKNGYKIGERRFELKSEEKWRAIHCDSRFGPCFGYWPCDIFISDYCNANTDSYSSGFGFSQTYTNDTGLDGRTFFTGSPNFQVKEIEVFEITD
jgi:hypothetical protein